MRSVDEHKAEAPASVTCQVITVSDTRTKENDTSGKLMLELLEHHGYSVVDYRIVKDEYDELRNLLHESAEDSRIQAVLLSGGTGIAPRDTTYEAVSSMLGKELPGFGEIFRYLSFAEDIGSAAILSRAIAGVMNETAVFSMPGSIGAVKLAMERIILPELRHVMREIYKK
ncbi:MogA/MoaB family molybdenum cofactor biosynthesis protein [Paenibacillus physcomitrellae]|uniref:Molybdenum cofactor biosynthesis protein B n=1 Tax=Paenibacillus physcomitrellae TaxID=1619311 RepID=A0ABQ1G8X0_9BACL|nr:MogA/MoaB family molybdenum cofactor biosynthesis protein [Paenibacillus physcomitrellae]GGA39018.1 molybdenum cofactor biosynthesis protein B [Paenibacillus physcomitrellae]